MPSSLSTGNRTLTVTWCSRVAADNVSRAIFVAPFPCVVTSIAEVHSVAGTDGGSVNINVHHDTGTDAPGAGSALLSNNSNNGFNIKGTINTVQRGTFKAGSSRKLNKGDRLSVKFNGTQTTADGVCITVELNRNDF